VGGRGLLKKREKGRRGESDSEGEGTGRGTDQADYAASIIAREERAREALSTPPRDRPDGFMPRV
jgi:hypothetical protein